MQLMACCLIRIGFNPDVGICFRFRGHNPIPNRCGKPDTRISLLCQKLEYLGTCGRVSDIRRLGDAAEMGQCGPIVYMNLNVEEADLEEERSMARGEQVRTNFGD